jgi:hypothetical protein
VYPEEGKLMSSFEDAYGNQINVGSLIAMAFSKSSSAEIRIGEVIEFVQSKPIPYSNRVTNKMRVRWYKSRFSSTKVSLVENTYNCVVLPDGYEL